MERTKCDECGGKVIKKRIDYLLLGTSLGEWPAEVCQKCNEVVFDEEVSEQIDVVAKEKGLWGLEAKARIGRVGSSYTVIINKRIAEFLGIKKGEEVVLYPESKHKLVIAVP